MIFKTPLPQKWPRLAFICLELMPGLSTRLVTLGGCDKVGASQPHGNCDGFTVKTHFKFYTVQATEAFTSQEASAKKR